MKRYKILVVEDEPTFLKSLNDELLQLYDVLAAMDGVSALTVIQDEIPDLIVLDIMLPKKNGFQLLEEIKKMPIIQDIPVIILSSLDSEENIKKGLQLGAVKYIVKAETNFAKVREIVAETLEKLQGEP